MLDFICDATNSPTALVDGRTLWHPAGTALSHRGTNAAMANDLFLVRTCSSSMGPCRK